MNFLLDTGKTTGNRTGGNERMNTSNLSFYEAKALQPDTLLSLFQRIANTLTLNLSQARFEYSIESDKRIVSTREFLIEELILLKKV